MKHDLGSRMIGFKYVVASVKTALVAGAFCLSIVSVSADQISTAAGFGPFQIGSGGEFTVIPDSAIAAIVGSGYSSDNRNWVVRGSFQTFCVERNEYIAPGTTYDVTLGNVTMFSGVPLSVGAAYLYQQFATGALAANGYYNAADVPAGSRAGYTSSHFNAYELQQAIWYFMGEYSYNPYNVYMNGYVPLPANPFGADNGAHGVSILSLWAPGQPHDPAHSFQDLLILNVPEPSSVALLSLAAAAFLAARRRK